ncbi:MipA/OmpV family protein [Psychromonas algicola]|uniref:MipA/OmpV family protein n=1 Tax=Psychromonas algicola TaxID=2555642 RepID=UPI001067C46D|nr:MipA/OmpV family protein [Psychromonas sp. RZ5]TEW52558.1 MipA/OmpV family protein [Psychromonas sp. RZ5]
MKKIKYLGLLIGACSLASFQVNAQDQYYNFGFVGGAASVGQSVFSDESGATGSVGPNLFYNGEFGFIDGPLINVSVLPYFGLTGQWRFAEVTDDNVSLPNGIDDRDGNGELGFTLGTVGARLTYLQDVTDEHDGYELQLHLGYAFDSVIKDLTLTPYAEIDYRDKDFSQHLYGISAAESTRSGLSQFDADNSFVYRTGVIGLYPITSNWLGLARFDVEHHDSDSALVQRDVGWNVSLGITYKFTD